MAPSTRSLFRFSPGELRREEYGDLVRVLGPLLESGRRTAVLLAAGESPSPKLLATLRYQHRDTSRDQWLLVYQDHQALLSDLWGLLLGAEPELLFQFDGDVQALLRTLDEFWFQPLAALRDQRAQAPLGVQLLHPHTLPRLSLERTALARILAPLIHYDGAGGFTCVAS